MFITTCNKIFHSFPNCAAGALCPQRIWRAVKNCLLLLLVALLAMPTISVFAVEPRAAKPVPPDGYTEKEITVTKTIDSSILTMVSAGHQTVNYPFSFSITELQTLPIDTIWNKQLYLESITVSNNYYIRYNTVAGGEFTQWYLQANHPALGVNFTLEPYPWDNHTDVISGTGNTPYLYLPFFWKNRAINVRTNVIYRENPAFASQKLQARVQFTFKFIYFVYSGTNTDAIINSVGDAAQQITNAITNNTNVVNNGFTNVQTGISTINGNLNNINTSIKNGFKDTVDNLQSLEGSVNSGFTDIENGIKQQTTQIQSSISNQTTQITQNNNQNTQKLLDQNSQFRQEDIDGANGIGKVATDFVNNTQATIKSKWEILWYPIEFTNSVLTVFTAGSSSRSYADKYNGVVGYRYNEDSGELEPIIDLQQARYGPRQASATITFPAYTLPVLNLQLWDSYEFDLGQVKEQFSALFNALYVVIGVLELYWFVGFLRSKYMDIFGG